MNDKEERELIDGIKEFFSQDANFNQLIKKIVEKLLTSKMTPEGKKIVINFTMMFTFLLAILVKKGILTEDEMESVLYGTIGLSEMILAKDEQK